MSDKNSQWLLREGDNGESDNSGQNNDSSNTGDGKQQVDLGDLFTGLGNMFSGSAVLISSIDDAANPNSDSNPPPLLVKSIKSLV